MLILIKIIWQLLSFIGMFGVQTCPYIKDVCNLFSSTNMTKWTSRPYTSLSLIMYIALDEEKWTNKLVLQLHEDLTLDEGRSQRWAGGAWAPQSEPQPPKWNDTLYKGLWRATILSPSQPPQPLPPPHFEKSGFAPALDVYWGILWSSGTEPIIALAITGSQMVAHIPNPVSQPLMFGPCSVSKYFQTFKEMLLI